MPLVFTGYLACGIQFLGNLAAKLYVLIQNIPNRQSMNLKEFYSQSKLKKIIKNATRPVTCRIERQDSIGSSMSDLFSSSMPVPVIDSEIVNLDEKV